MDDLFMIIGKLYADVSHAQKILESFQQKIKDKDQEIQELRRQLTKDNTSSSNDTE